MPNGPKNGQSFALENLRGTRLAAMPLVLASLMFLAGISRVAGLDVSRFLTGESGGNVGWGSPGGVAFDGTNFLLAARSTNGGVVATRFTTNGVLLGLQINLAETGGLPRVAFDGSNFLVAWADFSNPISDIYGQFIGSDGTLASGSFLIEAAADAQEPGGLAFDGTNYLAVWESDTDDTNAVFSIKGRVITPAGNLLGARIDISDGVMEQRFPDVAWNGENYLVVWTGQNTTNEWNVRGRRVSRDGALMESVTIGDQPAQQAWPPTVASDGTNWLAAWTRESGPYPVMNSNVWLPMLYGRIVGRDGALPGNEIQIRWGGLGQFKPHASFNGECYLVAWMEKVRYFGRWFWRWEVRQVNNSGELVMTEFWTQAWFNIPAVDPPVMVMGERPGRFVVAWENPYNHSTWESTLFRLNRSFALRNFTSLAGGGAQFDLVGPKGGVYCIEATTNLVNWNLLLEQNGSCGNHYPGPITLAASSIGSSDRSFFRVFDGQTVCQENLRLIEQAKDHWAIEHDKDLTDRPVDTDLFGADRYLKVKPVCPNGGTYYPEDMLNHPFCTFAGCAGHTL